MNTKHSKTTGAIRDRFTGRYWGVNLSINGAPVNHGRLLSRAARTRYYPIRRENSKRALERFIQAVERAAAKSLRGPSVLNVEAIERCDDGVVTWLIVLLLIGLALAWYDGKRINYDPENFFVNLWLRR